MSEELDERTNELIAIGASVGAVIILAAGVLVAKALIKNHSVSTEQAVSSAQAASGFAALPAVQAPTLVANAVPVKDDATTIPVTVAAAAVKELGALNELNAVAADTMGVFVFLPGKNDPAIKAPLAQMRSAAKTIEAQGQKIGLFTLKTDSPDYAQVAAQTPVPCVIAMVKGRGMVPVSGDITESKLIQGFVAASSSGGGCGPSSAGCGPSASGCNYVVFYSWLNLSFPVTKRPTPPSAPLQRRGTELDPLLGGVREAGGGLF